MSGSRVFGAFLALAVAAPPLGSFTEHRMFTHMLVQIPVLFIAGGLLATGMGVLVRNPWNLGGVPGLLATSLILAFWMLPIALDHAVSSIGWDLAKSASVLSAGAIGVVSWRVAPPVVRAFFVGNATWMSATVGCLYQADVRRLCNAYLQDDQVLTGEALVWLAVVLGLSWTIANRCRTGPPPAIKPITKHAI